MADLTASEHARILLAAGTMMLRDRTDEQSEALYDAAVAAVAEGDAVEVLCSLACSAAEGWARCASELDIPGMDMLRVVLANWATADELVQTLTTS